MSSLRLSKVRPFAALMVGFLALPSVSPAAELTDRDIANKIFNRINGVPPKAEILDQMEALVAAGDSEAAAHLAIEDEGGMFYNLTLRDMVSRWSNTDKTPRVALNDYVATVIGLVRDDSPFNEVLSADVVYTSNAAGAPAYSLANNAHYEFLDAGGITLHDTLQRQVQSTTGGLGTAASSGILSTRGFAEAYYQAGTNRRAVAFTLDTFLCREMESLMDTTRPDMFVRRDVSRAPGGDSNLYRNKCAGCHSGMDALGGAFAYYDWDDTDDGSLIYDAGSPRPKFARNAQEFPDGRPTDDDKWTNMWTEGQNKSLGWKGATSGAGLQSFGTMITSSDAFAGCMAERTFAQVCLHSPSNKAEEATVTDLASTFAKDGKYSMKDLFAKTAAACIK